MNTPLTLLQVLTYNTATNSNELDNLAELSRPGSTWKSNRSGKLGGTKQARHSCTNWYHPFLWTHIDSIAPKVGWSATAIEKHLTHTQPQLFSRIKKGTINRWIDKKGWSDATKRNVARRHALAGSGQTGVLAKYPDIVTTIKTELRGMRSAGLALNVMVVRALMIAIIEKAGPDLLKEFKCSEASLISAFFGKQY